MNGGEVPVRPFHPLLQAGLARRTAIAISLTMPVQEI
jgi:hypothetical protein